MQFNFGEIIANLNQRLPRSDNFAFKIARSTTVPSDYILNTILPQESRADFHIDGGTMTITPTMLGQVPMDEPYPPFGSIESSTFFENTTKLAGQIHLPEKTLRELYTWEQNLIALGVQDGRTNGEIAADVNGRRLNTVLGFAQMITRAHWDTYEWLRGMALTTGHLDWTFGKIPLNVDYNVPAGNIRTARTGNDAYQGTTTKFWDDIRWLYTKLSNFRIIMNSNTWYSIIDNEANNIRVVVNEGFSREIVKIVGSVENNSSDVRDRVRVQIYDKSGSVLKTDGSLAVKQFVPDGKIIVVGETNPDGFEIELGSSEDPNNTLRLGYTHIAPTVEGQMRPGIWSRIYTPQDKPMQVLGETAVNMLPVILNPKRLVILTTEVS